MFQQKEHDHNSPARIDWGWGRSLERKDVFCWRPKTRQCWLVDQLNRPVVAKKIPAREEKTFELIHQYECFFIKMPSSGPLSNLNNLMMPIGSKTISSGSLTSTEVILPIPGPSNSIQQKLMLRRANPSSYCASDPMRSTLEIVPNPLKKGPQCCQSASWHVQYICRRLTEMSLQFLLTLLQSMTLSPSLAQGTLMMWRGRGVIVLDPWHR